MRPSVDLSIVIVNWKSVDYVRHCVDSIQRHTRGMNYEITVIDNASFDGCGEMLSAEYPDVIYIQSQQNLGFAKANNLAVEAAQGQALLFLNPDTEIVGPAIATLYRALQELPQAGVVGAKLLNSDGTIQYSCIQSFPTIVNQLLDFDLLRRICPRSDLWGMAPLHQPTNTAAEVEVISGACLMLKRNVFEEVGRFNEDYFMYAEDADLCYKVKAAGWNNYYVPQATVCHFGGGSSKKATSNFSAVMMRESIWKFFRLTRGKAYAACYRGSMFWAAGCRVVLLGAVFPIQFLRGQRELWLGSMRKWSYVFLWSVHCGSALNITRKMDPTTVHGCHLPKVVK